MKVVYICLAVHINTQIRIFICTHVCFLYIHLSNCFLKMVLFWCRTVIPEIHQVLVQEGDAASVLGNCHDAVPLADFRVEGG